MDDPYAICKRSRFKIDAWLFHIVHLALEPLLTPMRATYDPIADQYHLDDRDLVLRSKELNRIKLQYPSWRSNAVEGTCRTYDVHIGRDCELRLRGLDMELCLTFESVDQSRMFVTKRLTTLIDMVFACSHGEAHDGLLWVGHDPPLVWYICLVKDEKMWSGMAVGRALAGWLDDAPYSRLEFLEFLLGPEKGSAKRILSLLLDSRQGLGLPENFPLFVDPENHQSPSRGRLTVKLESGCDWFLLVPLEYLQACGIVRPFSEIEWIVTHKSLTRNARQRQQIAEELSDLQTLLRHGVVILNTYRHFDQRCIEATEYITELLRMLDAVNIQTEHGAETLGLRWLLNPSAREIEHALQDPDTWYVFADFHVESGNWQLGLECGSFDLQRLSQRSLGHLRLLRIYHCNSVVDPYFPRSVSRSIVGLLLRAGAMRVEGSSLPESYLTFLGELTRMFSEPSGIGSVLVGQSLVQGKDAALLLNSLAEITGTSGEPTPPR